MEYLIVVLDDANNRMSNTRNQAINLLHVCLKSPAEAAILISLEALNFGMHWGHISYSDF